MGCKPSLFSFDCSGKFCFEDVVGAVARGADDCVGPERGFSRFAEHADTDARPVLRLEAQQPRAEAQVHAEVRQLAAQRLEDADEAVRAEVRRALRQYLGRRAVAHEGPQDRADVARVAADARRQLAVGPRACVVF